MIVTPVPVHIVRDRKHFCAGFLSTLGRHSDSSTSMHVLSKIWDNFARIFCQIWAAIYFPYSKFKKKLALLRSRITLTNSHVQFRAILQPKITLTVTTGCNECQCFQLESCFMFPRAFLIFLIFFLFLSITPHVMTWESRLRLRPISIVSTILLLLFLPKDIMKRRLSFSTTFIIV